MTAPTGLPLFSIFTINLYVIHIISENWAFLLIAPLFIRVTVDTILRFRWAGLKLEIDIDRDDLLVVAASADILVLPIRFKLLRIKLVVVRHLLMGKLWVDTRWSAEELTNEGEGSPGGRYTSCQEQHSGVHDCRLHLDVFSIIKDTRVA